MTPNWNQEREVAEQQSGVIVGYGSLPAHDAPGTEALPRFCSTTAGARRDHARPTSRTGFWMRETASVVVDTHR